MRRIRPRPLVPTPPAARIPSIDYKDLALHQHKTLITIEIMSLCSTDTDLCPVVCFFWIASKSQSSQRAASPQAIHMSSRFFYTLSAVLACAMTLGRALRAFLARQGLKLAACIVDSRNQ